MQIEFHRRMLEDHVRNAAFEEALRRVIVPGQTTVADIGAGTGVLGFMAQRLGAREVHLVEQGAVIELAARIADENQIPGLHFWPAHSAEIQDPPAVDVVVAEILGNFALEENALETLADARRFLRAGGTLIPARLGQFAAPIIDDTFWRELCSWDRVPFRLDFSAARAMSFDNLYVRRITPDQLLDGMAGARCWDQLDFGAGIRGERRGGAHWQMDTTTTIHGFALWWECELVPGVSLSTSPAAAPTHWDQIYAPILQPIVTRPGDVVELRLESETGGDESGIGVRWHALHQRDSRVISSQQHDIGRGQLA